MLYTHKGNTYTIPVMLLLRQNISHEELCAIVKLQKERLDLIEFLEKTTDPILMKIIYHQITELNYDLQILWGFETNEFRYASYDLPHCTCPKIDNDEDAHLGLMWINDSCPLHSLN